jgi:hypothetical protein
VQADDRELAKVEGVIRAKNALLVRSDGEPLDDRRTSYRGLLSLRVRHSQVGTVLTEVAQRRVKNERPAGA